MAYRIIYGPAKRRRTKRKIVPLIAAILLLTAALTGRFLGWGQYLIPGDAAVTAAAVEEMVSQIAGGATVKEAFSDFCREIIAHGPVY